MVAEVIAIRLEGTRRQVRFLTASFVESIPLSAFHLLCLVGTDDSALAED